MKTQEQIKNDISQIVKKYSTQGLSIPASSESKRDGRQLNTLTKLLTYLQQNPTEESLKKCTSKRKKN